MSKTSAKNVRNALKRLGIDEKPAENSVMFMHSITNYNISLEGIQQVLDANPHFNNFQLLESILHDVIGANNSSDLALFACYQLLSKYALEYNDTTANHYIALSAKHHLRWKLKDYAYGMIVSNRGCNSCSIADSICESSDFVSNVFLNAISKCEIGLCNATVVGLSESGYLRRRTKDT